jgi:hypothetical protein
MLVYSLSLATAGNLTTNSSANTETDAFFVTAGARNVGLLSCQLIGKGAGLTAISGIAMRFVKWGTGSTSGTSITPRPVDPGMQAATATAASRPTAGSTRTNHHIVGMGAAGPGGFVSENPDAMMTLQGSATNSMDGMDVSGTVSLAYEFSIKTCE